MIHVWDSWKIAVVHINVCKTQETCEQTPSSIQLQRHVTILRGANRGHWAGVTGRRCPLGLCFFPPLHSLSHNAVCWGSPLSIVPILLANTHTWCDSRIRGRTQMPQHGHYDLGTCPAQATLRAGPTPGDAPRTCQGQDSGRTYTLPSGSSLDVSRLLWWL